MKKMVNTSPDGNKTPKAVSPNCSAKSASVALPKTNLQPVPTGSPIGTEMVEETEGIPCVEEITNPPSAVMLSTNPYKRASAPLSETKKASIGIDSAISLFKRRPASASEISFLLMAKESSLEEAIFWAKQLGLKYQRPLAMLRRLL